MHLPLVEHLARRFRNRGEPYDDLVQVATIGLIKSVDRFDTERGVEFSTYATPTIVGEIKRHFRDKGWAVRVPRRLQELRLQLTSATGRAVPGQWPRAHGGRAGNASGHLGGGGARGARVGQRLQHTLAGRSRAERRRVAVVFADTLGEEDESLEGVEYRESLKPLLEQLPPREKKILLLRFFGGMTQSQIAAEIGISQMHVSRLLARTLAQLRQSSCSWTSSGLPTERGAPVPAEQRSQRRDRRTPGQDGADPEALGQHLPRQPERDELDEHRGAVQPPPPRP